MKMKWDKSNGNGIGKGIETNENGIFRLWNGCCRRYADGSAAGAVWAFPEWSFGQKNQKSVGLWEHICVF